MSYRRPEQRNATRPVSGRRERSTGKESGPTLRLLMGCREGDRVGVARNVQIDTRFEFEVIVEGVG